MISLQNLDREHAFGEADVRLLMTLAGSLSVALENARLFEETPPAERRAGPDQRCPARPRREPRDASDVRPRRRPDPPDLRRSGRRHRGHRPRSRLDPVSRTSIERGDRLPDEPLGGHRACESTSSRRASRRHQRPSRGTLEELGGAILQGEMVKSAVFVPLIVGGEATGRISLQNLDHEHAFSEADVRLLTTLAGSLSVALENARLFEETRQRNAELRVDQRRPARARREPRDAGDVRPRRRTDPRDLRCADRRHRRGSIARLA